MGNRPSQKVTEESVSRAISSVMTSTLQKASAEVNVTQSLVVDCTRFATETIPRELDCVERLTENPNLTADDVKELCILDIRCGADGVAFNNTINANFLQEDFSEITTKMETDLKTKLQADLEQKFGFLASPQQEVAITALSESAANFFADEGQELLANLDAKQEVFANNAYVELISLTATEDVLVDQLLENSVVSEQVAALTTDISASLEQGGADPIGDVIFWVMLVLGILIGIVILFFVIRLLVGRRKDVSSGGKKSRRRGRRSKSDVVTVRIN